jgi:hypothetical protein
MARSVTLLADRLDSGELSVLVGTPIYDNADQADLCLSADEWVDLLERRRSVGWPLHFVEAANLAVTHA